ncbi:MAG TPA: ABC transporter permease [Baekduia sp.]|nr:ABC transporter permease [Baekduia sp.]HMJ37867.1 ABC transporter permease [Baekduia sp.]
MSASRVRMRPGDVLRTGGAALLARPWRTALSALGIAVGIGAAVAVLGVSASSRAALLAQLGAQGNLITVGAGQGLSGTPAALPTTAPGMIARIPPVQGFTAVGYVAGATVRRTAAIPAVDTGGVSVLAAQLDLPRTLGARVAHGAFLNAATARYPATVLGAAAAATLGIDRVTPVTQVFLGGTYFTVVGILRPVPLTPEIDQAAIVGFPVAGRMLGLGGHPTSIYVRALPDQVRAVTTVLPFTANPSQPEAVQVSRPSALLAARATARTALTGLFLALGAVAVIVGAMGVANIMVISVLERRTEIGLRRALGARRHQVATQFVVESLVLCGLGGVGGIALGALATAVYAVTSGHPLVVPLTALAGGVGVALAVGAIAGVYPAIRAARLAPTEALRAS